MVKIPAPVFVKFIPEPAKLAETVTVTPSPGFTVKLDPVIAFPVPVIEPLVKVIAPTVSVSSARSKVPPLTVIAALSSITSAAPVVPDLSKVKVPAVTVVKPV